MRLHTIAASLILALPTFLAAPAQSSVQPDPTGVNQFPASQSQQPSPSPDTNAPTIHVTTREVIVDVEVTDAAGNPVHGLKRSDFAIEENGKPQSIRSFREFISASQTIQPAPPKLPNYVYTNSQSVPTTGPVNILLFDALHSKPQDIVSSLQFTAEYLHTMPQGTSVCIFWLSASGLHMLQGFTTDRDTLLRAVHNNRVDIGLIQPVGNYSAIDALNQIAAYVSGIKGRKNLLWFTRGMPVYLMRDGGYGWGASDMSKIHRLMDVYDRFTAEQIAVYPIDAQGLAMPSFSPRGFSQQSMQKFAADETAEETGGEAFYNSNDLKASIAKAIDHGSQFYTLSYIPPNQKYDGHYHHTKVEVIDHPELHLVYRKGYNAERVPALDSPAPGPALMKASMEGNAPAATQILFDAGVWPSPPATITASPAQPQPPPQSQSKKSPLPAPILIPYEIHYGFPASEIAFTEDADGTLSASVEFDVATYDDFRKLVGHLSQTVTMRLSVDKYDEFVAKPFHYTQKLDLPLGQLSLHVGILDNVNSKVGTLEIPLIVRPYRTSPPRRAAAAPTR